MKKCFDNVVNFISKYNIPLSLFALYVFLSRSLEIQNCIFKLFIGYPCPGCGMSRAVFSILHLDFGQAFFYNPFVYVLPIVFFMVAFQHKVIVQKILKNKWIGIGLIFLVFLSYVLRFIFIYPNAPMDYYPHNLLALILSLFK